MFKSRPATAITLVFSLALLLTPNASAQSVARRAGGAAPASAGMSAERLARIRPLMEQSVKDGKIAGVLTLVMRNGKVAHLEAVGNQGEGRPMREDTIFRIASMTKAVTSVAAMMLHEEGRLPLGDPLSKYVPEFKNVQVAVPGDDKTSYKLVPAKSEITIRHLLTHTSGLTYRFIGIEPWAKLYKEAGISDGLVQTEGRLADNIKKLAALPLMHHPGERYSYSLSTDVLGYVVEVVSGMSLDEFFRTRIFEPLKMRDTHFFLPAEKLPRLATVYNQLPDGRIRPMGDRPDERAYLIYSADFHHRGPRTYYSGGAGLVSTITDYGRFLQMLLQGGELDGARVLGRKTVELMTVNHVGELFGAQGFGLGFSVVRDLGRLNEPASVGQYGWGGFFHTNFFVDPKEKMIGIFMSQLFPANDLKLHERFRTLTYQSIVD